MYLLQANVTMDVTTMPFEHLIAVLSFLLVLVAIIFVNGFSLKLGEREINIGGIRRLLAKKEEDTLLQQQLKKFADEIDDHVNADLYDIIDEIDMRIEKVLQREHCYFTKDKFYGIIKRELYRRVRRNNLRERLSEDNIDTYVNKVLRDIQERYKFFQIEVKETECNDEFADFQVIKKSISDELFIFYNAVKETLIKGMRRKIEGYKKAMPQFKTLSARKFSCDIPIEKNEGYIRQLSGEAAK
uniref:Uncharacterized protein n=1 Tax=uncultured bacterium contig00055 TaxID=1181539 RepID=A0A806KFX9_9BACT|nr:hypothetical protein [uncultured bacterium contig00055]